jgi:hypothetical protein
MMPDIALRQGLDCPSPEPQSWPPFTCYLDDYPDHLVPARFVENNPLPNGDGSELEVNPDLVLSRIEDLPVGWLPAGLLDNFELKEDMVWVGRAGRYPLVPFWLRAELFEVVSDLIAGQRSARDIGYRVRWVLWAAEILIEKVHASDERRDSYTSEFQQKGYAPAVELIHPFHLSALRKYYRKLQRQGLLRRGDSQSERRFVAHNERVAQLFHHQLTPAVEALVGEPIKPSYVYAASYQGGAQLAKHVDREQCEFSVTLCVDYSPEPGLFTPWPLQLHTASSLVTVFQGLGDGLVYRGRDIPHSRETIPAGQTSTSIFFHYVPADFSGPLD